MKVVCLIYFSGNKQRPVFILAWYDGKPNIHTKPGYECDGRLSNHIIIKIPKAHPDHAGEYTCIATYKQYDYTEDTLSLIIKLAQ